MNGRRAAKVPPPIRSSNANWYRDGFHLNDYERTFAVIIKDGKIYRNSPIEVFDFEFWGRIVLSERKGCATSAGEMRRQG